MKAGTYRNSLVMAQLALDSLAVRAVRSLRASGVNALLLKGPTTARWLYPDPLGHVYTDVDLLVAPRNEQIARRVLARDLGLTDHHAGSLGIYRPPHESAWVGDDGVIDLHVGLADIDRKYMERGWDVLWDRRVEFRLHGETVPALDLVARSAHVVIHASGKASSKAIADLERLMALLDLREWGLAAGLAEEIGLRGFFADGIRGTPGGQSIAEALNLPRQCSTMMILHSKGAIPEAAAIARLSRVSWVEIPGVVMRWFKGPSKGVRVTRRRLIVAARLPRAALQVVRARHKSRVMDRCRQELSDAR